MERLKIDNLEKNFGGVKAVDDFSMKVGPDSIISIVGPNGAGKTTVFNLISGIVKPDKGKILLNNEDITGADPHNITRMGVARTFQNIRLFSGLTVLENVMTARDTTANYGVGHSLFNSFKKNRIDSEIRDECLQYLEQVGLQDHRDNKPENLPYGLQRKLEIARALALEPSLLMLDEPAAGLNSRETIDFIGLITELHEENDFSILLIEHRMRVVMELSRWIYVLNFGKKLAEGTPEEIQNNPEVIQAYIGEEEGPE